MTVVTFKNVSKLSSSVIFLKHNLNMFNMPLAQKALNLMIEEMCFEKGFYREGNKEHYYYHLVDVTNILINFGIRDEVVITAAILHDSIEDIDWVNYEYIKREFGVEIADVVKKVTKNSKIDYKTNEQAWIDDLEIILADMRAALVKTADRIHNFSTLTGLPMEKQYRKALETEKFFFPFFKAARKSYPEHSNLFIHAKISIEPYLLNIKYTYSLENRIKELEAQLAEKDALLSKQ